MWRIASLTGFFLIADGGEPINRRKLIILASGVAIIFVFASYAAYTFYEYLHTPRTFYDNGVTDEQYIAIANQTLEAQVFQEKYPNSTIWVDRSGALAVEYRVDTNNYMQYLRLRVFIDWRTNKPSNMFIDNSGTYITENLLEYIETARFPI